MKKIAVVYHSGQGHTECLARELFEGVAGVGGVAVDLLKADALSATPDQLTGYDGFIWCSPTYLGGVSGVFKTFMDATGRLWKQQRLKGKLAAGFTVSSLPSGGRSADCLHAGQPEIGHHRELPLLRRAGLLGECGECAEEQCQQRGRQRKCAAGRALVGMVVRCVGAVNPPAAVLQADAAVLSCCGISRPAVFPRRAQA